MWPWPCPFQGQFVISRVEHAMINVPTIFEVPIFASYGDIKGVSKCGKWGYFGVISSYSRSSEMSPFDRAYMISYSSVIETMRLSCTVFKIQRVICRNSPTSKGRDSHILGYNFAVPGDRAPKISEDLPGIRITPQTKFHADRSKKTPTAQVLLQNFWPRKEGGYSHILSNNFAVPWGSALGLTAFARAFRAGVKI